MQGNVGDVVLFDKVKKVLTIIEMFNLFRIKNFTKRYTPIGVVVIPSSHNVYGDGSCGVISLVEMNCITPTIGSVKRQSMCWGEYVEVNTLKYCNEVIIWDDENLEARRSNWGYLPSSIFNKYPNRTDKNTSYISDYKCIPSPYLTNGKRNDNYSKGERNALADFDGRGNTDKILAQRGAKDYTTWKPTYNIQRHYIPTSCCDMFSTVGTKQGDWYLPSCGELGYVIARLKEINYVLEILEIHYPNTSLVALATNCSYWSSSECSRDTARYLSTHSGSVDIGIKSSSAYVRAFLKM